MIKVYIVIISLLFSFSNCYCVGKDLFYSVFASESKQEIENVLSKFNDEKPSSLNNAYKGALFMKSAGFGNNPRQKLELFIQGKNLLEKEISLHPSNYELRFLRLVIQSESPSFLQYSDDIEQDAKLIAEHFASFDSDVQIAIKKYASNSELLQTQLFK